MAEKQNATSTSRFLAFVAIVAGALLAITSLLADVIGVGGGGEGIGWKQLIAAIAGIVIALTGIAVLLKPGELISDE